VVKFLRAGVSRFQSFVSSFWFFWGLFVCLFCQVQLQQERILFGLLKVFQAHLELVASGLVGGQTGGRRL
jgi:hypothetical protein